MWSFCWKRAQDGLRQNTHLWHGETIILSTTWFLYSWHISLINCSQVAAGLLISTVHFLFYFIYFCNSRFETEFCGFKHFKILAWAFFYSVLNFNYICIFLYIFLKDLLKWSIFNWNNPLFFLWLLTNIFLPTCWSTQWKVCLCCSCDHFTEKLIHINSNPQYLLIFPLTE